MESLYKFSLRYYPYIACMIENQQRSYGLARIHSHRHISRCLIYSDWYCNYLNINDESERFRLFLYVSLHDIGRKGELEDVWEFESNNIYRQYITLTLKKTEFLIEKSTNEKLLKDISHDVDCLDIMRLGTGRGGIMGFDKNYLLLFKDNFQVQETFQNNAWNLICLTDSIDFDTIDCLYNFLNKNKNIWRIGI